MLKDFTFNCNTLTLKKFVSNCIVKGNSLSKRPRAKERVVSVYSQYSADVDKEQYEDFYRVQLMLNHVFTEINDLKEGCNSFSERYQHCIEQSCSHISVDSEEENSETASDQDSDSYEEESEDEHHNNQPAWMELAARNANDDGVQTHNMYELG